jgi:hypothetical protein
MSSPQPESPAAKIVNFHGELVDKPAEAPKQDPWAGLSDGQRGVGVNQLVDVTAADGSTTRQRSRSLPVVNGRGVVVILVSSGWVPLSSVKTVS